MRNETYEWDSLVHGEEVTFRPRHLDEDRTDGRGIRSSVTVDVSNRPGPVVEWSAQHTEGLLE